GSLPVFGGALRLLSFLAVASIASGHERAATLGIRVGGSRGRCAKSQLFGTRFAGPPRPHFANSKPSNAQACPSIGRGWYRRLTVASLVWIIGLPFLDSRSG
ncbi:MAG TPA: hypothetical protein PLF56_08705, partial [Micropruina sp.]|nr:hypothetical protein [Micropruina sp.]